jgi:energy-converting hydrogenase Eha subunit E
MLSVWAGIALIVQGLIPFVTDFNLASINWEIVTAGLSVIFLRFGIAKPPL